MNPRNLIRLLLVPAETILLQLPRALIVSVLAMILDVVILFTLVHLFGVSPLPAAVVGYLTGGVVQYALCSVWVFPGAPRSVAVGFVAFTILSLGGLGITAATIHLLHESWGMSLSVAKLAALGLAFNWNFFSRKYLLFRADVESAPAAD
jgi:putative flippase GtrA